MWLCTTVKALTNGFHTERFVSNPHWAYYYSRIFHKNFPGGAWNGDQSGEVVHRMLRRPITCRCSIARLKGCPQVEGLLELLSREHIDYSEAASLIMQCDTSADFAMFTPSMAPTVQFLYLNGVGSTMVQKFMFKTIFFQSLRTKKVIQPVHS